MVPEVTKSYSRLVFRLKAFSELVLYVKITPRKYAFWLTPG